MKKILITGKDSYIGTSLENWLNKEPNKYEIDTLDMRNGDWKEKDFSPYDVVFHVAGIAHIKKTEKNADLYYKVNRDLAYETAEKAKEDGSRHFIFLSSMSVYGVTSGIINKDTKPKPKSYYGESKYEAEQLINNLSSDDFHVSILRPPMVYGKGCKGNFQTLFKFSIKTYVFPDIENERSMIFVDNLCEFVKNIIEEDMVGIFYPQNSEYTCTRDIVKMIANSKGRKVIFTKIFNWIILNLINKMPVISKIFDDLTYEKSMSKCGFEYEICSFKDSIKRSI